MKVLFESLINFIVGFADMVLYPVNQLVINVLPDFAQNISDFVSLINTYFGSGLAYFFSILPPHSRVLVLLYLGLLITCYTITLAVHLILKVFELIKQIKVW